MARPMWCRVGVLVGALSVGQVALGQQLLDRVLARVGSAAITMTDVQVVVGLGMGLRQVSSDSPTPALESVIDRRLVLDEVARFPPPEPTETAVAAEVASIRNRLGVRLSELLATTGRDDEGMAALVRDTLRARAYIAQRFGTSAQVRDDDVRAYYDEHAEAFIRDGVRVPFEQAEDEARRLASADRLRITIDAWIDDLRVRAEIVRVVPSTPALIR